MTRWAHQLLGFEKNWVTAVFEAFTPDPEGLRPHAGEVDYVGTFQNMLHGATVLTAIGLRIALWVVALSPLWRARSFRSMSSLGLQERAACIKSISDHQSHLVREACMGLKIAVCFALFASVSVRTRSQYDRGLAEAWPLNDTLEEKSEERARVQLPVINSAQESERKRVA